MKIGDLVMGNNDDIVGMIVDWGWCYPEIGGREKTYEVHWPSYPSWDGWYDEYDLKLLKQGDNNE